MKSPLLFITLLASSFSFAQEQKNFDTEYARLMSQARQWEAKPVNIQVIKQKHTRGGRNIKIKTVFTLRDENGKAATYRKNQKIKHTKTGIVREQLKITKKGRDLFLIEKLNDKYLIVNYMPGSALNSQKLLLDQVIIIKKVLNHKVITEYFVK
jgi:hypothetical protein